MKNEKQQQHNNWNLTKRNQPNKSKAWRHAWISSLQPLGIANLEASHARNSVIVWRSDIVIAFKNMKSTGTLDTISKAKHAKKSLYSWY